MKMKNKTTFSWALFLSFFNNITRSLANSIKPGTILSQNNGNAATCSPIQYNLLPYPLVQIFISSLDSSLVIVIEANHKYIQ